MQAINVQRITKIYKKTTRAIPALSNLSLEVDHGEVFGFLGPNGAGKTTTMKILMNLIAPSSGMAWIMGNEFTRVEARRHVGFLPENPMFYDYLTLEELLWFAGRASALQTIQIRTRIKELLALLDIERARKLQLRKFSKGMTQRAGLAYALIADPQILILDEPMSGLDPVGRRDFVALIRKLKAEGKTIFFSSHVLSDIENLCDSVGILVKGELRKVGKISGMLHESSDGFTVRVAGLDAEGMRLFASVSMPGVVEGREIVADIPKEKLAAGIELVRARGASVVSINTKRISLEDVFMDVVGEHG